MVLNKRRKSRWPIRKHCTVSRKRLKGSNVELTDFRFQPGGNVYVFSYEKNGMRRHTFIDAGERIYQHQFLDFLSDHRIDPSKIERIFITHRHVDHCGLAALLAEASGATIVAHPAFRDFVENRMRKEEKWWLRGFDPTTLKKYDIRYLENRNRDDVVHIGGLAFQNLAEPIDVGNNGYGLRVLACPESRMVHSPDQLVILYSPSDQLNGFKKSEGRIRPSEDIVFAGDLWLMRGPVFDTPFFQRLPRLLRLRYFQLKYRLSGRKMPRLNIREQDAEAKQALKTGFSLVTVKPGHGEEFLGARVIPGSLMADRDLLQSLGFSIDTDTALLNREKIMPRVSKSREEAYSRFVDELRLWQSWGYSPKEISQFLGRIFSEQAGGRGRVKEDRQQRRARLAETIARLKRDVAAPAGLRHAVETPMPEPPGSRLRLY